MFCVLWMLFFHVNTWVVAGAPFWACAPDLLWMLCRGKNGPQPPASTTGVRPRFGLTAKGRSLALSPNRQFEAQRMRQLLKSKSGAAMNCYLLPPRVSAFAVRVLPIPKSERRHMMFIGQCGKSRPQWRCQF